jgi:MarR family transcriptional regulator, transcriptional regulator for hemolysin
LAFDSSATGVKYIAQHMLPRQEPIGLLLASVRKRQRQAVEMRVRDLKLSTQQFWLLVALCERQGASLADILAALPMDQPTASRVVAAVCRRKLVRIQSDPKDRRRKLMTLTPLGRQISERCLLVAAQVRGAIVTGFSAEEIDTLRGWLRRIVENLDELDRTSPPDSRTRTPGP